MRAPDRLTRTVLVVSLVLATTTPLVWDLTTPPANAGAVPTVQATPLPLSAADAADQTPTARMAGTEPKTDAIARRAGSPADNELRPATRSARIADLDLTPNPTPKTLRIPSIDVDAQIGAIGVEANGDMEVPDNARNLGWYRHGPAPDDPGATVIAGHVDSRTQGPGAFFDLRTLDVGARTT